VAAAREAAVAGCAAAVSLRVVWASLLLVAISGQRRFSAISDQHERLSLEL
jgi:hypothetical protein